MGEFRLIREKDGVEEVLMNRFTIDEDGDWREPGSKEGINLPLTFRSLFRAECRLHYEQKKDPSWNYEIDEYLK